MALYGKKGLEMAGHSRGSMTVLNKMKSIQNKGAHGSLEETLLYLFGPAASARTAAGLLYSLSNGKQDTVYLQSHNEDFVGAFLGGNPLTYDTVLEGSSNIKEWFNMFEDQPTVYSCYGSNIPERCGKAYGTAKTIEVKPCIIY